nr:hypothetical protein [Tanacetum cinerariifolium]
MLDRKELSLTLDDFKTIFHLPQATNNNHDSFVLPPSFSNMIPFYKNHLGFTMELKTPSRFKTTGLLQPCQTLCKIFSKCLTMRVTGWDQPPLPIMQMMYYFINKIHIIIGHYMTNFPEISRRARDKYHNMKYDDLMKNIFNSGRYKDKVGMKIPDWMILEEMKQTEHYRMYAEVFKIDVPLTQSQPTESTQGTHKIPSAPRSPNPKVDAAESSAPTRSTVIRLRIPQRRSTRLTPPAPVPTINKADELILQDTLQMVEGQKSVIDDSSTPRNAEPNILGTRLEPKSDMESPEVEFIDVVIPVNVYDEEEEEDEIIDKVYELKQRKKWMNVEEYKITPFPKPIRSPRIHTDLELQGCYGYLFEHLRAKFTPRKSFVTLADHLHEAMADSLPTMVDKHIKEQQAIANDIPSQVDAFIRSYLLGHILHVHPAQPQTTFVPKQQYQLYLSMKDDPQLQQQDIAIWLALQMKFERLQVPQKTCRIPTVHPRDHDDPHDDAHPKGENSAKWQKTSEYETDSYASDDDEIPTKQVSQDIMKEESRKEILVSPHPRKTTPIVLSCQRDPEAPTLSLMNQDLSYLKKGNLGPEKTVSKCVKKFNPYAQYGVEHWKNPHAKIFYIRKQKELVEPKEVIYSNSKIIQVIKTYWELGHEHKFITEIIVRRANKCIVSITEPDFKNLNKNDIEDMYLLIMNGKVPDYAETRLLWSLSVFIRSLVIRERVHDFQLGIESYQQKVNLTAPTISFLEIKKHEVFSIIYEPVHGIIYKNSKKEKRVMRHSEIHKFCDATLNRVLEGLKSYNNDVKYGYFQRDLTKDKVAYMKLFEEEIKDRLKYQRQMRSWESYVNGRPLGLRRERSE